MSVRARIAALGVITFMGLATVAGVFWWSQERVGAAFAEAEHYSALDSSARELAEIGAQLESAEKAYLLSPGDSSRMSFEQLLVKSRFELNRISKLANDPSSAAAIGELRSSFDFIETTFAELNDIQARLGFNAQSGLRAALAESSGAVEARIAEELKFGSNPDFEKMVRAVIQIRGAEKDFTLGGGKEAIGEFDGIYAKFEELLERAYIPNEAKEFIGKNMAEYKELFGEYAKAANSRTEMRATIEAGFSNLPPALDRLKKNAGAGAAEAAKSLAETRSRATFLVGGLIVAVLVLVAGLGALIGSSIIQPLKRLRAAMEALAEGHTNVEFPSGEGRTELAAMARTVQVFRDNALERQRLAEARAADDASRDERVRRLEGLISSFDATVERALSSLDGAADELSRASREVESASVNVAGEAERAGTAARIAAENVTLAAAATEELAASITEIAGQAGKSTTVASRAVEGARQTAASMSELSSTADKIGQVMGLIRDIANQTNLLALNATIEAARAGEHGKGFAVVAAEVKDLASQTATATEDIAQQVEAIQLASANAVSAIEDVTEIINEMNGIATAVAASVEQQDGAVRSISENVASASGSSSEGAAAMDAVAGAGNHARQSGNEVERLSRLLNEQAKVIREEIRVFLDGVRAA
ncbi:HAMP domain-containing protein [Rhizobiales bacterium]|nr:methyl-accepting chemotaxis protein [Hongsoonwoonella zoysiae]NRG17167.1 HAMP domain-containing protein [Hongsoonwoonella zoysiae]